MRVYINIHKSNAEATTGIGQVVLAQYEYLPKLGISIVSDPGQADIIATHIEGASLPRIDVLHCHGLYFRDVPHLPYATWHLSVNARIAAAARRAISITVPSDWVAEPFRRDMRVDPVILGHGLDLSPWTRSRSPNGYVYYNKNREGDVCTARWAYEIARRENQQVVSTFAPRGEHPLPNMAVTGPVPHREVVATMAGAGIYLATTMETFGIGTIEALAAGVPVLGFDWGGTRDIIKHKENGWLAEPENIDSLIEGLHYIREHWRDMSEAAWKSAKSYSWERVMERYAHLYEHVLDERGRLNRSGVTIVITNYNYAQWLEKAIQSAIWQTIPCEVIVVDDGSTDNSRDVINHYSGKVRAIYQQNQGVAAARNAGIAAASNEYVVLLDADDILDPHFAQLLWGEMKKDAGMGIAYTGLTLMDAEGRDYARSDWPPDFDWNIQSTFSVPPSNCIPSACMIRREMWKRAGGIHQRFAPGEDAEFWTRGLSTGFTARRVTFEGLFHYRNHGGGASKRRQYIAVDDFLPFLHDKDYPFAAPVSSKGVQVRSYAQPVVSVIVPVGPGHESIVEDAILSVTGQTLREWELVVVNDTGGDLGKIREKYPFIKLVDTGGYQGAGEARNRGMEAARAPTVVFLDADDLLQPRALELMLVAFVRSGGKYIYTDWIADTGSGLETKQSQPYNQNEYAMYHPVTVMMATDQARALGFDPSLPGWEDWEFFIKAAIAGICGERVAEPLLVYRTRSGTRRNTMVENGQTSPAGLVVLEKMREKYARYYKGEEKMAGCCGGNSAVLAAKRILEYREGVSQAAEAEARSVMLAGAGNTPLVIRMEYVGENVGEISFMANGRIYRGGNNPHSRYKDCPPEDALILERSGKWRRVTPITPVAPPPAAAVKEPEPVVEVTAEDERRAQELIDKMLSEEEPQPEPEQPEPEQPEPEQPERAPKSGRKRHAKR